jgi:hypothetical protein
MTPNTGDGYGTGAEGTEFGNGYDSYSFFGNGFGEGHEGYGLSDGDGYGEGDGFEDFGESEEMC